MYKILSACAAAVLMTLLAACGGSGAMVPTTLTPLQSCRQALSTALDDAYHHDDYSQLKDIAEAQYSGCQELTTQQQEILAIQLICAEPAAEQQAVANQIGTITPGELSFMCSLTPAQLAQVVQMAGQ